MTIIFNTECQHCKINQDSYQRLLEFAKMLAKERNADDPFYKYVKESAHDLLVEIGEL